MFDQDNSAGLVISVAVGVAVIFTVIFVLGLLCGLFGLIFSQEGLIGHLTYPLMMGMV